MKIEKILVAGLLAASLLGCAEEKKKEVEPVKPRPVTVVDIASREYRKDDSMADIYMIAYAKVGIDIYELFGDKDDLRKSVKEALKFRKLKPDDIRAPAILGLAYYMLGDYENARKWNKELEALEKAQGVRYDYLFPFQSEWELRKQMYVSLSGKYDSVYAQYLEGWNNEKK